MIAWFSLSLALLRMSGLGATNGASGRLTAIQLGWRAATAAPPGGFDVCRSDLSRAFYERLEPETLADEDWLGSRAAGRVSTLTRLRKTSPDSDVDLCSSPESGVTRGTLSWSNRSKKVS
jgi:hypothetical protein